MATKQFNSRIQWKKDTSSNWTKNNPVLLNGEIAIVVTNTGETRFKVGDGTSAYTALPFQDEAVRALITAADDKIDAHISDTDNPHEVTKAQIGLSNVDNVKQYSASNPPPYPVTSVNGDTGAVNLTASDINAVPTSRTINGKALTGNIVLGATDVEALPISGGTLTGNLTGEYLTGTWLQSTATTGYNSSDYKGICIFDNSGWVYYRTPSQILSDIGGSEPSVQFSGTLPTSSWVSSSGNYYYQVNISGITSDSIPLVYPQWTTNRTNEQNSWNNLLYIQTFNGYVRFYSSSAFTTSVSYILLYNI